MPSIATKHLKGMKRKNILFPYCISKRNLSFFLCWLSLQSRCRNVLCTIEDIDTRGIYCNFLRSESLSLNGNWSRECHRVYTKEPTGYFELSHSLQYDDESDQLVHFQPLDILCICVFFLNLSWVIICFCHLDAINHIHTMRLNVSVSNKNHCTEAHFMTCSQTLSACLHWLREYGCHRDSWGWAFWGERLVSSIRQKIILNTTSPSSVC